MHFKLLLAVSTIIRLSAIYNIFFTTVLLLLSSELLSGQQATQSTKLSTAAQIGFFDGCKSCVVKNPRINVLESDVIEYCNCVVASIVSKYSQKDMNDMDSSRWQEDQLLKFYNTVNNLSCIPLSSYFLYEPNYSNYSIHFVLKPNILLIPLPKDSIFKFGETAELNYKNNRFSMKVEFIQLDLGCNLSDIINEDYAYSFLNQYAIKAGFENASFKYDSKSALGKFCEMQAYKTIVVLGQSIQYIWLARFYSYQSRILVAYYGTESKRFPNLIAQRFFNSIKIVN